MEKKTFSKDYRILPKLILVEQIQEERMTKSGLIIPVTQDSKKETVGKVILTGSLPPELQVNVGDFVIYKKNSGRILELDDNEYTLLNIYNDALAIY